MLLSRLKILQRYRTNAEEVHFLIQNYIEKQPLIGMPLPYMVKHADFCTANMTLQKDGIGVFDWEFKLQHELPLFDFFFFFSSTRFPFTGPKSESSHYESFKQVFWGQTK